MNTCNKSIKVINKIVSNKYFHFLFNLHKETGLIPLLAIFELSKPFLLRVKPALKP